VPQTDHYGDKSEGFWRELFLLKPDTVAFGKILEDIDAETLLHVPVHGSWIILVGCMLTY